MAGKFGAWVAAMRPHTLPLAFSGSVLGSALALAYAQGSFSWATAVLSVLTALLLQILSNLANDYGDYKHGADNDLRKGPERMVASGRLSVGEMKNAVWVTAILAFVVGLLLLWSAASAIGWGAVGAMLVLGLLCIGAAIAYTATARPYGYAGLGDLSVFLFFGLVLVVGTCFLHTGLDGLVTPVLLCGLGAGLLSTAVLNVNNMRDMESDAAAGKRTVALRLGLKGAKVYHTFLIIGGIMMFPSALLPIFFQGNAILQGMVIIGFALIIPIFIPLGLLVFFRLGRIWRGKTSPDFAPLLKTISIFSATVMLGVSGLLIGVLLWVRLN